MQDAADVIRFFNRAANPVMPLFWLSWELAFEIETMSDLIFGDVETVISE